MSTLALIVVFTVLSGTFSMFGGVILLGRTDWVRKFSIHFISFAAGTLLASAFLDLLPEALELADGTPDVILGITLVGVILFFFAERVIYKIHSHHYEDSGEHRHATPELLLLGDGAHNFVDGIVIAAAFLTSTPLGIVTALAVAAHELPQEISDFSIMLHHGWTKKKVLWLNLGVSLTSVLGALVAFAARDIIEPFLPSILAITAGVFIYIAASDLLPEISPETTKDKGWHVIALLILGILSVWLIGRYFQV